MPDSYGVKVIGLLTAIVTLGTALVPLIVQTKKITSSSQTSTPAAIAQVILNFPVEWKNGAATVLGQNVSSNVTLPPRRVDNAESGSPADDLLADKDALGLLEDNVPISSMPGWPLHPARSSRNIRFLVTAQVRAEAPRNERIVITLLRNDKSVCAIPLDIKGNERNGLAIVRMYCNDYVQSGTGATYSTRVAPAIQTLTVTMTIWGLRQ